MRKIINGARYDTDTAKKLGHWESGEDCREFSYYEESLYRTKAGKYFIHGAGNAASTPMQGFRMTIGAAASRSSR